MDESISSYRWDEAAATAFIMILSLIALIARPADLFGQPELSDYDTWHYHQDIPRHLMLTAEDQAAVQASIARSDTFDILNYDIDLDVTAFTSQRITSNCTVTFTNKISGGNFSLDLLDLTIDSIVADGERISYRRDGFRVHMAWPTPMMQGDTHQVSVYYGGTPTTSESTFGGFYFQGGYAFNLGIDLVGRPHNFGRSWFPCFDNFVERSTYDIHLTTTDGRIGYASGRLTNETTLQGDTIRRSYRQDLPIPTYLAGVAVSDYVEHNSTHQGAFGPVPIQIVARPADLDEAIQSLAFVEDAIDAFEYWYGPYEWDRVGYIMTARGAMEHAESIAYPVFVVDGGELSNRLMSHELCHHWWGNTTTMRTAQDMWIKEGNAEYGVHLFEEFIGGEEGLREAVRNNHAFVLIRAHRDDGDYLALSPIAQENTYGTHTYYRGASVMHNMRAYLGDSLFRHGQNAILERYAYQAIDAAMYRDALMEATDYDLTAFFDDWILAPGYADYMLDHSYTAADGDLAVVIKQQRYESPAYHTNTPLPITLFFEDGSTLERQLMVSGPLDTAWISSDEMSTWPSMPTSVGVNIGQRMNLAMFEEFYQVSEPVSIRDARTLQRLEVDEIPPGVDAVTYAVEAHLTGTYGAYDSARYEVEDNLFWHVSGNIDQAGIEGRVSFFYDDNDPLSPSSLSSDDEENIVLLYRRDATEAWEEHPDQNLISALPGGKGRVDIFSSFIGDHVLAKRRMNTGISRPEWHAEIELLPNPTSDVVHLSSDTPMGRVTVYDASGRLIKQYADEALQVLHIDLTEQTAGQYYLQVESTDGLTQKTLPVSVVR